MRICQKNNCNAISIPRGKYCEDHRTNKKKITGGVEEYKSTLQHSSFEERQTDISLLQEIRLKRQKERAIEDEFKNLQIEEDRLLKQDQDLEFQETMKKDIERIKHRENEECEKQRIKEDEELQEAIFQSEIENKRSLISKEPDNNGYNIKFNIPKTQCIIHNFPEYSSFRNVFDFLDVYFYDNKIPIVNYNLVVNFPKKIYSSSDFELLLCDEKLSKNTLFFLQDLDI